MADDLNSGSGNLSFVGSCHLILEDSFMLEVGDAVTGHLQPCIMIRSHEYSPGISTCLIQADAINLQATELYVGGYRLSSDSGDRWGIVPVVEPVAGVMEVGQYIDFHANESDTSDYTARIHCDEGGRLYANNNVLRDVQAGSYSIPAGEGISGTGYKDYTFSFGHTFATAPTVVASLAGGSTAGEMGSISVGTLGCTTTTCTIRLWANGVSAARNPTIRWIAAA